jgi:hypothetical protein
VKSSEMATVEPLLQTIFVKIVVFL